LSCRSSAAGPHRHGGAGSVEGRSDPERDSAVAWVSTGGWRAAIRCAGRPPCRATVPRRPRCCRITL
jgi:hypothetical protein